jgi:hypothetical protein
MKICGLALALVVCGAAAARGQVSVEVTQGQDQYLQGESMVVAVRITNLSGQTLHLGADPDWLTFSIASPEGLVVTKLDNPPVVGEFDLESSKVAVKRVDLGPYFVFGHAGRFGVAAIVRIKGWGVEIASPTRSFNIIEGAKLWEQSVGVPQPAGASNSVPEIRRYTLQQANYLRGELRLYLRVTDSYGKTLRVRPIGQMVSFGRPQAPQIDRLSNLHVLYQNGPVSFSYTEFDPNGELLARQTYDYTTNRPHLKEDVEGNITVTGGTRRVTDHDVPPPKETTAEPEPGPGAASTNSPSLTGP